MIQATKNAESTIKEKPGCNVAIENVSFFQNISKGRTGYWGGMREKANTRGERPQKTTGHAKSVTMSGGNKRHGSRQEVEGVTKPAQEAPLEEKEEQAKAKAHRKPPVPLPVGPLHFI